VSDEKYFKTRYYLLSLLIVCSSAKLSSNFNLLQPGS
jgi:hypothetical protein